MSEFGKPSKQINQIDAFVPLAIRGLGKWTNKGSSIMVMALCGNALMPLLYGKIADISNPHIAYIVLIPCFAYLIFYAFFGYKIEHWKKN